MSTTTLPDRPARVKPESPLPNIAMLDALAEASAARDRIVAENLKRLCRTLEGRDHG